MRDLLRQKVVDSLALSPPELTRRDIHLPAVRGKALAVIGMRRSGKTTFLWQCLAERLKKGGPRESLLYLNFEDERLVGMNASDLSWLVEEYFRLQPRVRDATTVTFFFDEIQNVHGWEPFVRRLLDGGFPEALGAANRDRGALLRSYVDVVVLRDVIERYEVSNPVALRWMQRHLLANAAAAFSVQKFYNDLRSQGIPVGKDTLHAYLGYLEDAFLVRTIALHTGSERQRMVNPRKAYPVDPGLIPLYERTGRPNLGRALETAVLVELERRGREAAYVRTKEGFEVDFLAIATRKEPELIQVCTDVSDPATREREVRALDAASKELPDAKPLLLTLDSTPPRPPLQAPLQWRPAAAWLLNREEA